MVSVYRVLSMHLTCLPLVFITITGYLITIICCFSHRKVQRCG